LLRNEGKASLHCNARRVIPAGLLPGDVSTLDWLAGVMREVPWVLVACSALASSWKTAAAARGRRCRPPGEFPYRRTEEWPAW